MAYLRGQKGTVTARTFDSPVLTTPALGTPSAGVMTNMTGAVEASLVDNAVTLAKMAGGTDGNIISYDASGNPVAIATGTDGQVLTSTGAGSPPAFEAAAAGGGDNTPYWRAKIASNYTFVEAEVNWSDTETLCFDSDSAFASNYFTAPAGEGGYYQINANTTIAPPGSNEGTQQFNTMFLATRVDGGSWVAQGDSTNAHDGTGQHLASILSMVVYIEAGGAVHITGGSSGGTYLAVNSSFSGFKLAT